MKREEKTPEASDYRCSTLSKQESGRVVSDHLVRKYVGRRRRSIVTMADRRENALTRVVCPVLSTLPV